MRFEWDETKNRRNIGKHRIGFDTAKLVFEDPHAITFQDSSSEDEDRWQTFGMIRRLIVMVAHTCWDEDGEEVIRLISARKATSRERRTYEAHQKSG